MLLIVTNREDHTSDWLIGELHRRGARFVRFNTEDYPLRTRLTWRHDGTVALEVRERRVELCEVKSVWYRRPVPPVLPATLDAGRRAWAAGEAREALEGVWRTLAARWVNHPDRNRVAASKPAQLRAAQALGLTVAPTLLTNDVSRAREFARSQPHGAVVKPLTHGRLDAEQVFFTSRVDTIEDAAWTAFGDEPYLLQARIPKRADVRVTVIGDRAFAVRIHSQDHDTARLDFRRVSPHTLRHEPTTLPAEVAAACVRLVRMPAACSVRSTSSKRRTASFYSWRTTRTDSGHGSNSVPLRAAVADLLLA